MSLSRPTIYAHEALVRRLVIAEAGIASFSITNGDGFFLPATGVALSWGETAYRNCFLVSAPSSSSSSNPNSEITALMTGFYDIDAYVLFGYSGGDDVLWVQLQCQLLNGSSAGSWINMCTNRKTCPSGTGDTFSVSVGNLIYLNNGDKIRVAVSCNGSIHSYYVFGGMDCSHLNVCYKGLDVPSLPP